jgi:hypothetical protein
VVLGTYDLFSGSTNLGRRAFWWSKQAGFYDLGSLVNGGLSANGFDALDYLTSAGGAGPGGSPAIINGWGLGPGQVPDNSTLFQLQAQTPEPAAASLACSGGVVLLTLLSRRGRK